MTFGRAPFFEIIPRLPQFSDRSLSSLSLRRIREIVAGKDSSVPRSLGMAMLLRTDLPSKHWDFAAVLENEREAPSDRYLAAISLGGVASPAAKKILERNSDVRDQRVLAGVMKALGQIGDEAALDVVVKTRAYAAGAAAEQADFAATLISHRIGLEGRASLHDRSMDLLRVDARCARPLQIVKADDADAELCLRSLAIRTFGIEPAERPMYLLRCGHSVLMLMINRKFLEKDSGDSLLSHRSFFGLAATRSATVGTYFLSHLLLTSPVESGNVAEICVYRPRGTLVMAGMAKMVGERFEFSLSAVARPGAFAVLFEGTFEAGEVRLTTALTELFVQIAKREPLEDAP